ncbi:glycine zipper family protein [Phaeobacter inhibens]|uniref:glycine zipper domain-containing protein n=1 Tax=Phaeobacter inhibens TaxID=221822 RepID=UPI0021A43FEC|nr:glycine zipper domain-containing protein [Phaeobacter inhibens]UWR85681.1 glycine zipper family protein [Phaeobacter inhibens]
MKMIFAGCAMLVTVAACSNSFDKPLLTDGPKQVGYEADLGACRALAEGHTEKTLQSGAVTGAVIGGIIGAVDSKDGDRADDALVGAVLGGGVGALEGQSERDEQRRTILIRCMQGRGHRVLA